MSDVSVFDRMERFVRETAPAYFKQIFAVEDWYSSSVFDEFRFAYRDLFELVNPFDFFTHVLVRLIPILRNEYRLTWYEVGLVLAHPILDTYAFDEVRIVSRFMFVLAWYEGSLVDERGKTAKDYKKPHLEDVADALYKAFEEYIYSERGRNVVNQMFVLRIIRGVAEYAGDLDGIDDVLIRMSYVWETCANWEGEKYE